MASGRASRQVCVWPEVLGNLGAVYSAGDRKDETPVKWLFAYLAAVLVLSAQAHSRPPVPAPVFKAVRAHWKARAERIKAFDVVYCESGYSQYARNGQYLGLWQFGRWARGRYGFGWDVWSQTQAAYRYYRESGWSGWECA